LNSPTPSLAPPTPSLPTRYAPVGILFLIAGKIVEMDDIASMGGQLGMYTITVISGLMVHAILVLPTLYFLVTRKNPFVFIGGLLQALITALGTSSRWVPSGLQHTVFGVHQGAQEVDRVVAWQVVVTRRLLVRSPGST